MNGCHTGAECHCTNTTFDLCERAFKRVSIRVPLLSIDVDLLPRRGVVTESLLKRLRILMKVGGAGIYGQHCRYTGVIRAPTLSITMDQDCVQGQG